MASGKVFSRREIEEDIVMINCDLCGKEDLFLHSHIIRDNQYLVACPACLNEILNKIKKTVGGKK